MSWKDKLPPSQAAFVQDIVDQVPEAMGARNVFVAALDALAGAPANPKWTHVIVDPDAGEASGTNDKEFAEEYATNNLDAFVIDVVNCKLLQENGDVDDIGESIK